MSLKREPLDLDIENSEPERCGTAGGPSFQDGPLLGFILARVACIVLGVVIPHTFSQ